MCIYIQIYVHVYTNICTNKCTCIYTCKKGTGNLAKKKCTFLGQVLDYNRVRGQNSVVHVHACASNDVLIFTTPPHMCVGVYGCRLCVCVCVYVCVYVCVCVCVQVCVWVCVSVFVYMYVYV